MTDVGDREPSALVTQNWWGLSSKRIEKVLKNQGSMYFGSRQTPKNPHDPVTS